MQTSQTRLDRTGATLSILCAIHCMATPLILVSLPAAAKHSEAAEAWIVGASLLIGLSSIRASWRRNGAIASRIGIAIGLAAIVSSRLLLHGMAETILVFTGAAILITSHLFNCRECRNGCAHSPRRAGREASTLLFLTITLTVCSVASTASAQVTAAPRFVVSTVETFLGWPYRLGGNSARGLDCSALVQRAFRAVGVELPRTAQEQFQKGCAVSREELAAGDLVFFHEPLRHRISHVGVYIGDARFIHAGRHGVLVASLHAAHWARRFAGARRLIEIAPAGALDDQ